jgi:hypothetical protein
VALDGPGERMLKGDQVGHVNVGDVDAFLGKQRGELAQGLFG